MTRQLPMQKDLHMLHAEAYETAMQRQGFGDAMSGCEIAHQQALREALDAALLVVLER